MGKVVDLAVTRWVELAHAAMAVAETPTGRGVMGPLQEAVRQVKGIGAPKPHNDARMRLFCALQWACEAWALNPALRGVLSPALHALGAAVLALLAGDQPEPPAMAAALPLFDKRPAADAAPAWMRRADTGTD